MQPVLYQHTENPLSAADLNALVQRYAAPLPFAYAECEQDVALIKTVDLLAGYQPVFRPYLPHLSEMTIAVSDWDRGRIFGQSGELRWQRLDDEYSVHLLTESDDLHADIWQPNTTYDTFDPIPDNALHSAERAVMLIGTRTDKLPPSHNRHTDAPSTVWIETSYPRPLTYPVADDVLQVRLVCLDYRINGAVVLSRLKDTKGADDVRQ